MVVGVSIGCRVTPRMVAGVVVGTIRSAPAGSVVSVGGADVSVVSETVRSDAPISTVSPT